MKQKMTVTFNEVWEFQYALILAAYEKYEEEVKEFKIQYPNFSVPETREKLLAGLSSYLKSELQYFFSPRNNMCDGIGQEIIYDLIGKKQPLRTIEDLLAAIKNIKSIELVTLLIADEYSWIHKNGLEQKENWEQLKDNEKELVQMAHGPEFNQVKDREKWLECIENPDETKERLHLLLCQFYERVYKKVLGTIKDKMAVYVRRYEEELEKDVVAFLKKYINNEKSFEKEVMICISYCRGISADLWLATGKSHKEWLILGYYNINTYSSKVDEEKILEFMKTVSDKNRVKIIQLLKKRSYYVLELAEELKMTAPTMSYHLSLLQNYEVVSYERIDHRLYYSLNKEKLATWFDRAKRYYL